MAAFKTPDPLSGGPAIGPLREAFCVLMVEKTGRIALAIGVGLSLLSCAPKRASSSSGGALAVSSATLMPQASPGEAATLRLGAATGKGAAATEFPVTLRSRREGSASTLELVTGGETLERETYEARAEAFRVVAAGDDSFAPPLDLLRYPVREGDVWEWQGKVIYAGVSREAHAKVKVAKEGEEIRSDVALSVAADPGRPELQRRLTFWFRRGKGVVRRSFGDVSSRYPTGEAWRP